MKFIQCLSFGLLALFVAAISLPTPAHADNDKLDFTLVNKTGYGIKGIYIAPSASTDWGDNVIEKALENGDSLDITFSPKAKAEHWDMRIVWVDPDDDVIWKKLDLTSISEITLHYDRKTGDTTAETK